MSKVGMVWMVWMEASKKEFLLLITLVLRK